MWSQGAKVTEAQSIIAEEVERYLLTGESDSLHSAWSGGFLERANRAHDDLRGALVRAVRRLTERLAHEPLPEIGSAALTRAKVEPMVRGLFPRAEQDAVLATLEQSVVFITSANIERLLHKCAFDSSAWTLANLYLASLGAELLGKDAPCLVGLSEEITFHEKAGCQVICGLVSSYLMFSFARISGVFVAGEAAVKAERSEFILSLDGRRCRP